MSFQAKHKMYKHGKDSFKAYCKTAGQGYEVGVKHGSKQLFVSNFIHKTEANQWYQKMNKEMQAFGKRYWVGPNHPRQWYSKFLCNHLYSYYYKFVGKCLNAHNRSFTSAFNKDVKKYRKLKKDWTPKHQIQFKKAA